MSRWTPQRRADAVDAVLSRAPVLPVLSIERVDDALPLARALVAAGLPVLEVTLRSDAALEAIARIARELPEAVVGAGTVLDAGALARSPMPVPHSRFHPARPMPCTRPPRRRRSRCCRRWRPPVS